MKEAFEAKSYTSKGGRIHYSYISGRKILNHIEYPETIEPPKELIKFYSVTQNSVNALTNGYLWATNPFDFNDPFDCPIQLWNSTSFANNLFDREIFYKTRLATLGIICLNEFSLKDQDVLWGYYTNQEGFAIKFNSHHLINNWGFPFKVDYLKKSKLDYFNLDMLESPIDVFPMFLRWSTQKKRVWKNENEWRFIFSNLEADSLTIDAPKGERSKKYNSSAIKEIILGFKFFHQTNMVEESINRSYYIIDGNRHKLQNEILNFLSFPSEIPVKHMYQKPDKLELTPRPCKIFKDKDGRFRIDYLQQEISDKRISNNCITQSTNKH